MIGYSLRNNSRSKVRIEGGIAVLTILLDLYQHNEKGQRYINTKVFVKRFRLPDVILDYLDIDEIYAYFNEDSEGYGLIELSIYIKDDEGNEMIHRRTVEYGMFEEYESIANSKTKGGSLLMDKSDKDRCVEITAPPSNQSLELSSSFNYIEESEIYRGMSSMPKLIINQESGTLDHSQAKILKEKQLANRIAEVIKETVLNAKEERIVDQKVDALIVLMTLATMKDCDVLELIFDPKFLRELKTEGIVPELVPASETNDGYSKIRFLLNGSIIKSADLEDLINIKLDLRAGIRQPR